MARRCCCGDGCPSFTLSTTSDWTVSSGTFTSGTETNAGTSYTWLDLNGTIAPGRTLSGTDAEAYNIEFWCRGDITVTIDGKDFSVAGSTGTLTADGTSITIPQDSDHSYPIIQVQIRTTPTHTYIASRASVDYGTSNEESRVLGAILTADRSADPSGNFTLSGTGDICTKEGSIDRDFAVKSTRIVYDGDCVYDPEPTSVCPFLPIGPVNYRLFYSALQSDPATFYPKRFNLNDPATLFLWPNINPTYTSASEIVEDNGVCVWSRTPIDGPAFGNEEYANWVRTNEVTVTSINLGGSPCFFTGFSDEYTPSTIPSDLNRVAESSFPNWDLLIDNGSGGTESNSGQWIAFRGRFWTFYENVFNDGSSDVKTWNEWPFGGSDFGVVSAGYYFDLDGTYVSGGCSEPYKKPTFRVVLSDVGGTQEACSSGAATTVEVPVNDLATGLTASRSAGTCQDGYELIF